MTLTVQVDETTLPDLLQSLKAGDEVILTSGSDRTPVARIEPIPSEPRTSKRLGFLEHLQVAIPDSFLFEPLPEEELRLWEADDLEDPLVTGTARP